MRGFVSLLGLREGCVLHFGVLSGAICVMIFLFFGIPFAFLAVEEHDLGFPIDCDQPRDTRPVERGDTRQQRNKSKRHLLNIRTRSLHFPKSKGFGSPAFTALSTT